MKKALRFWVILLAVAVAASWVVSCRDDIEVPFPPSIIEDYTGIYQYTEIRNGVDTVVDTTQLIEFTFRRSEWTMDMDGNILEDDRVFCDCKGTYVLGNGVEMTIVEPNYTRGVCTEDWGPDGYFGLDQTTDTMRLLNDVTDSLGVQTVRLLRLVVD